MVVDEEKKLPENNDCDLPKKDCGLKESDRKKCFEPAPCKDNEVGKKCYQPTPCGVGVEKKQSKLSAFFYGRCKRKRSANCTECVKPPECEPCHGVEKEPEEEKKKEDPSKRIKCKPPRPPDALNRKKCI